MDAEQGLSGPEAATEPEAEPTLMAAAEVAGGLDQLRPVEAFVMDTVDGFEVVTVVTGEGSGMR